ncbi:VanZ family protein [Cellvibrio mixtus]|uniref:hypothetical protein n=1 Tax=Cellvibrio mixtus TaxID=39650 RepID=UPI000587ABFD|nr:hypothetical protein [Cellvibrio mixtus]
MSERENVLPGLFRVLLCLAVLLASPLFFVGGPDWVSPDIARELWNFGHIVFFTTLTLLIHQFISLAQWHRWLLLTGLVLVVGIAIELIQGAIGRHKSWQDVFYNLTGVWVGLFWFLKPSPWVWSGRFIALVALSPAVIKVLVAAYSYGLMHQQMPVVNNFDSSADMQQVHFNSTQVQIAQSENYAVNGKFSLAVTLNPGRYSGLRLTIPARNWVSYRQLKMSFFNPDPELLIVSLRISDLQHDRGDNLYNDRFNKLLTLKQGWNEVLIPVSEIQSAPKAREMNLAEVSSMGLFTSNLAHSRKFFWDYIYLE